MGIKYPAELKRLAPTGFRSQSWTVHDWKRSFQHTTDVWNFTSPEPSKVYYFRSKIATGFYATFTPIYATFPNSCHSVLFFPVSLIFFFFKTVLIGRFHQGGFIFHGIHSTGKCRAWWARFYVALPFIRNIQENPTLQVANHLIHPCPFPQIVEHWVRHHVQLADPLGIRSLSSRQAGLVEGDACQNMYIYTLYTSMYIYIHVIIMHRYMYHTISICFL